MSYPQMHTQAGVGAAAYVVDMTDTEILERIRGLVRILLTSPSPGLGPIRVEDWNEAVWTGAQRSAYAELRAEAGLVPEAS
jgi:hypothetical protein